MIATKGEPYLKTPADELSFIVRNSLDVYAILAACCCIFALAAKTALQLLFSSYRPVQERLLADGNMPWVPVTPKTKAN